jgi:hypothetical protein
MVAMSPKPGPPERTACSHGLPGLPAETPRRSGRIPAPSGVRSGLCMVMGGAAVRGTRRPDLSGGRGPSGGFEKARVAWAK